MTTAKVSTTLNDAAALLSPASASTAQPRSAYIHVPFCRHRCGYCDFAIITGRDDLIPAYLDAIEKELSWLGQPREVDTLYFGGGTPSHLSLDELHRLCDAALRWHPLAAGAEWTVEANPEDVTPEELQLLADRGVTRLSLGAQSFDDAKLGALDRRHMGADVKLAIELAHAAGIGVCIDLMFAAPGETLYGWRQDLRAAIDARPEHVSTYGLTWERGASFTSQRDRGELQQLDEQIELAMYAVAIDALTAAGFYHYEVSNFAQSGCRSRHNEAYWDAREYYAAGPGAARYVAGVRETNHRSTTTYLKRVLAGESPVAEREQLDAEHRARERLVLGLRRMEGINRTNFAVASGFKIDDLAGAAISRFVDERFLADDGRTVRLTREGLYVSDALWPELL